MIMILLVIYSEEGFQVKIPEEGDFKTFQTSEIYNENLNNNTWEKDHEEGWANEVARQIREGDQKYRGIIIDKHHSTGNWQRAVRLAGHIALTLEEESLCPIFLTDFDTIDIESADLKDLPILDFFQCPGVYYKPYSELFRRSRNKQTGEEEYAIEGLFRKSQKVNWKEFHIPFKHDNRHQISNEWGAISLALNAGYEKSEISYDYPETLYFKFLQKKFHPNLFTSVERKQVLIELDFDSVPSDKICFTNLLQRKKILLIDDNAEKGWSAVLEKLFDCDIDRISYAIGVLNDRGELKIDPNNFDIIFLDLYIPNVQTNKPELSNGLKILKKIKQAYPGVPVVVFTASNKAWNLDKVQEEGADGMYIKESPLFIDDKNYSKENFKEFLKTVKYSFQKYDVLRPFWEEIEEIQSVYLPLISDTHSAKIKSRVSERLEMFFGLLKRGFEQRKFNKERFFFDDNELAFMTLWSILNDIQEAYFEKARPNISLLDNGGNTLTHHPAPNNRRISYLKRHFKWKIQSQSDVFVEYEYSLKYDRTGTPQVNSNGFYILKHDQVSQFSFQSNDFLIGAKQATRTNYETTIFMQIAFLLEKMVSLSSSSSTKAQYQQELVRLNEIRNHLYLTHGDEISSNYYASTESDKRKALGYNITPKGDIKPLFELVGFLLTGQEIRVSV